MPMRTEPGEPTRWIASTLYAGEWSPAGSRTFGSLRLGYSVKPTAPARRRLAALMFADPHATPLGMRLGAEGPGAGPYALNVFLALAVPESRLVTCFRDQRILAGVIAGRGFAVLGGTGKTITRIEAFGERSAGRLLASLVAEWRALGRPGVDHLRIRVAYDGHPRGAWRTFRRGEGWISFDWA